MSTQKFPNELFFCQAQGPTLSPTQGQGQGHGKVKVMVRSWSGHGQDMVRSGQVRSGLTQTLTPTQKWDLSYTLKLVSTHSPPTHSPPPSLNECLVNFVTLCDTL